MENFTDQKTGVGPIIIPSKKRMKIKKEMSFSQLSRCGKI